MTARRAPGLIPRAATEFAQTLADHARRLAALERASSLAKSAVEDGAITAKIDGQTTMLVGRQFDGTSAPAVLSSLTPPAPTQPIVTPASGGLTIKWDGEFADDDNDPSTPVVAPMDFKQVDAVVIEDTGDPLDFIATPPSHAFPSARGGEVFLALPPVLHHVALVTRTLAGSASVPSVAGGGIPDEVATAGQLSGRVPTTAIDTDPNLTANSDTKIASQKATKAYVDANAGGGDWRNDDLPTAWANGTSLHAKPAITQTFPRGLINGNVNIPLNTMIASGIRLRAGQIIEAIGAIHTSSAVNNTRSMGIYDLSYNLLASGTDTGNWSNGDPRVINLDSPYTVPDDGYYYIAFHSVAAHALAKMVGSASGGNAVLPVVQWTQAGGITSLPATATPVIPSIPAPVYFWLHGDA